MTDLRAASAVLRCTRKTWAVVTRIFALTNLAWHCGTAAAQRGNLRSTFLKRRREQVLADNPVTVVQRPRQGQGASSLSASTSSSSFLRNKDRWDRNRVDSSTKNEDQKRHSFLQAGPPREQDHDEDPSSSDEDGDHGAVLPTTVEKNHHHGQRHYSYSRRDVEDSSDPQVEEETTQRDIKTATSSLLHKKNAARMKRKTTEHEHAELHQSKEQIRINSNKSPYSAYGVVDRLMNDKCPQAFLTKIDGVGFQFAEDGDAASYTDLGEGTTDSKDLTCWSKTFSQTSDVSATEFGRTFGNRECMQICSEYANCEMWTYYEPGAEAENAICRIGGGFSPRWNSKQVLNPPPCPWVRHETSNHEDEKTLWPKVMAGLCHPWFTCGFLFHEHNEVFLPKHECDRGSSWENCREKCCKSTTDPDFEFDRPLPHIHDFSLKTKTQRTRVLFVGNSVTFGKLDKNKKETDRKALAKYVKYLAWSLATPERLDVDEDTSGGTSVHMRAHTCYLEAKFGRSEHPTNRRRRREAAGNGSRRRSPELLEFKKCEFGPNELVEDSCTRSQALGCPQKGLGVDGSLKDWGLANDLQFPREEYVNKRYDIISLQDETRTVGYTAHGEHFFQSSVEFYQRQYPDAIIVAHMVHAHRPVSCAKVSYSYCNHALQIFFSR
ncbi:unnamed protein product [Amoebophrya sp. A120]|nr:unnamed protein product [Amoebophrya sp. A120]|eukprot:GSA120T00022394001.1